ncbi:phosphatase PAP2 family protein [Spartinivicinus poritis]|uniref:undecaprenyl-diphosphate phosphatase n=1 Tax=Spartinivicinus poritis TaxID=2994640 RepID=A0ABT5UGA0_9GAMM|nr:phosphatase PAP2 family protein [Spartinivicinus sp. A2-2]MDE1464458.1 phosphatase PAP2 family protein [Spartinivicinus sp. A2-2]
MDVAIINWAQAHFSSLHVVFQLFSWLGYGELYLVIIGLLYWGWNPRLGVSLSGYLLLASALNGIFKLIIHAPRPYWLAPELYKSIPDHAFGMPSGHANSSLSFWGRWALTINTPWFWLLCAIIVFVIGLSRVFLGAHFPSQVVSGWGVALSCLIIFSYCERKLTPWFSQLKPAAQIALVLCICGVVLLIGIFSYLSTQSFIIPEHWITNAYIASQTNKPFVPVNLKSICRDTAMLAGLWVGAILYYQQQGWQQLTQSQGRLFRCLGGVISGLLIWYGLGVAIKTTTSFDTVSYYLLQVVRSFMFGLWVSYFWPSLTLKWQSRHALSL